MVLSNHTLERRALLGKFNATLPVRRGLLNGQSRQLKVNTASSVAVILGRLSLWSFLTA